jgi:hypothetical protein
MGKIDKLPHDTEEFCTSVLTPRTRYKIFRFLLKKSTRVNYLISSLYKLIVDIINYFVFIVRMTMHENILLIIQQRARISMLIFDFWTWSEKIIFNLNN